MANKYTKTKTMPVAVQKLNIERIYSNIEKCVIKNGTLFCILKITPSETSDTYRVEIQYKPRKYPIAYLLSPKLVKREGKLPRHLYPHKEGDKPPLCVFYPNYMEWTGQMQLAKSFIPWISTWLNAYEYWVVTGIWHYPESPHGQKTVS